jgi:hypothetical protein
MEVAGRLVAAALVVSALMTGCRGPDPQTTSTASEAPSPYDAEERALYREALRRLERFESRNARILAAGRATSEAKRFYRDHLREWQQSFSQLKGYERAGIRIADRPVVLGTRAASIESFQDNAAEVVLERCTDQSELGMTRDGVPVPPVHDEPVIQQVVVHRYENRTWLIGAMDTTGRPCVG